MSANTNTAELAQRIAELPPLPPPSPTHYREHNLSIERMEMFTAEQSQSYAIAAQDKYAAPLIARIAELKRHNAELLQRLLKINAERERMMLPDRVIDTLWQAAGLSTYHPRGDQLGKFYQFAHGVTAEVLARLPDTEEYAALAQSNGQSEQQQNGVV